MDTPTPPPPPSVKQRLRALLGAGVGSLVLATASLAPPAAEASLATNAQRPALADRVREMREQLQGTLERQGAKEQGKDLLAWGNWGNWGNWHNWHN
jgi:hypothetical protein